MRRMALRNDTAEEGGDPEGPAEESIAALLRRRRELSSAFQPIQELRRNRVVGYEALLRLPAGTGFRDASEAFAAAARTNSLAELEIAALETHFQAARELAVGRLFVNLSSRTFADERIGREYLTSLVAAAGLAPGCV